MLPEFKLLALGYKRNGSWDLNEEEFSKLVRARDLLNLSLSLEVKLDLALENFTELESSILNIALRYSLFEETVETWRQNHRLLNRRFSNFLSTSRIFLDHSSHSISSIFGKDSNEYINMKKLRNIEYDTHLGYRVFEELRNFTQHRDLPVHKSTYSYSRRDGSGLNENSNSSLKCKVELEMLCSDERFKRIVIEDLRKVADKDKCIDLMPLACEFLACLVRIKKEFFTSIEQVIRDAEGELRSTFEKAKEGLGVDPQLLLAFRWDGNSQQNVYIDMDIAKEREILSEKNKHADLFAKIVVIS